MEKTKFKHVFGPVPSRRLGRSLGIDLVPFKTCSYDCIYCQLGRTTDKTIECKEYVPLQDVLTEIDRKLDAGASPDYITLSGSGEPTLYSKLQQLISVLKDKTEVPVAVLTNGSLLWDKKVQEALLEADLIVPSLDAGDEQMFRYVNRPHKDITCEKMVDGLVEFRKRFSNNIWLEVFLLGGVTGMRSEVEKIIAYAEKIRPDRVQLNTVARPPAEDFAFPVELDQMQNFARMFGDNAEVVADYDHVHQQMDFAATREDVMNLLRRRPCSLGDVAQGLGIHHNEAVKHLDHLTEEKAITTEIRNNSVFYLVR
jgi:wyosine [tRNA(Phe)-imidazoG37] synthetase (radical SAM superfamily)